MRSRLFAHIRATLQGGFVDEARRRRLLFCLLNLVLAIIALIMTIVNIFTQEYTLMLATMAFSFLCGLNYALIKLNRLSEAIVYSLFGIEACVLLAFFIITGIPQGFSVLWTLLVPSFALAIFGRRMGGLFSAAAFFLVIFFFWFPPGTALLRFPYSATFMLRFPFVYICLFFIALYVESIRVGTFRRLQASEANYRQLYRHDQLTGLYNRYAFREELERLLATASSEHIAVLLIDIDDFKRINDRHGHNVGDDVLRCVAQIIRENICEHCIACRWGGEEFLVLMQCRHSPQQTAEAIRRHAEKHTLTYPDKIVRFTVSIGLALSDSVDRSRIFDFINAADVAMYRAKANGKNCITTQQL